MKRGNETVCQDEFMALQEQVAFLGNVVRRLAMDRHEKERDGGRTEAHAYHFHNCTEALCAEAQWE